MGKVRIVSGGTDGLYQVEVLHNRERIEDEIEFLEYQIEQLEPKIADSDEVLHYAEMEVQEATITVNALIDKWEEEGELPPVDLARLVTLHNNIRAASGLGTLTALASLNEAAQNHANWMVQNDSGGHTGANGSTPRQRALQAGYTGSVGENLISGMPPPEDDAIDAWMNSPSHKANILRPEFEHIGLAYTCRPDGQYRHFWVAVFGAGGTGSAQTPSAPENCVGTDADVPDLIQEAIEALVLATAERSKKQLVHSQLIGEDLSLRQRLAALQKIPADPIQAAWCADYTENLTGDVASIEIPGEGNKRLIVRPGYSGRAVYNTERDGQLFHRHGLTGAQAFLAAAILPGWQKWMPTYRVGTLTAVDTGADTGNVTLDAEQSSAQALDINQGNTLAGVPIEYMDCDSAAFEVGDRVVVKFVGRDWAAPKIVGFESNPKDCLIWPAEVRIEVFRDALADDLINTDFGDDIMVIRVISNTHGCCGYGVRTNRPLNMRKSSLTYGGAGSVVFVGEGGAPVAPGFNLDDYGIEADKIVIDELWGAADQGDRRIGLYNERAQEIGAMSFVTVQAGIGTATAGAPAITWLLRTATGYSEIALPARNHCAGATSTGWVGTNADFLTNSTGAVTSVESACQGVVSVPVVAVETTQFLAADAAIESLYPHITAFAVAKGAIDAALTVKSADGSGKTYVADGYISTAGTAFSPTRVWMKFTREDLIEE